MMAYMESKVDMNDELAKKKALAKKKHFPMKMNIHLPNRDDVLVLEDHSSMKVKTLRQKISELTKGEIDPLHL